MMRRSQGFTLLEVLLAVILLGLLIAGAYSGIRASAHAMRAGEAAIDRTDRLRTAQEFLRRQLSHIMPLQFARDDSTGAIHVFDGNARALRFVAPMPGYLSRGAFRRRLHRYGLDWREDEGYSFFIYRDEDEALLGGIGLANLRRGVAETASLGYWIGMPFARKGYMEEALGLTLTYGFDRLGLHRIEAACLPGNVPSRSLLEKLNFREEGYAKRYLCIDGRWQDHVLYALLVEEWQALVNLAR